MSDAPLNLRADQRKPIDVFRAILSILAMLIVAPIAATTALVCYDTERWGAINPLHILAMAVFGVFTTPLWPTYIPAIFVTPFLMHMISLRNWFTRPLLWLVLLASLLVGIPLGVAVISPLLLMSLQEKDNVFGNWAFAGAVAGAITLMVIILIHRCVPTIRRMANGPEHCEPMVPPILAKFDRLPPEQPSRNH